MNEQCTHVENIGVEATLSAMYSEMIMWYIFMCAKFEYFIKQIDLLSIDPEKDG